MNPLATGTEVEDRGLGRRCSLFDEQSNAQLSTQKNIDKKIREESTPEILKRSDGIIKLNNPYDELSKSRQHRIVIDSSTTPDTETRKTIFTGSTK